MCTNPYKIKNPLYGRTQFSAECGSFVALPKNLHSNKEYINVPCSTCPECRNTYINSILQRGIVESLTSYLYFVTLTYDNRHIPCLCLPDGTKIYYSDYTHIQNLFKRIRSNNIIDRDFRYLCVNEYGDKRHRPHFHLIIFIAKLDADDDYIPYHYEKILYDNIKELYSVNVGTKKNPIYQSLFTFRYRMTATGPKTNYFVKYVEYDDNNLTNNHDNTTYVKTLRYLLGYVSKGSTFDATIRTYLERLDDVLLQSKLLTLLRTKIRYSKGFGCGFIDGQKFYVPPISKSLSYSSLTYSKLCNDNIQFSELLDLYPDLYDGINEYLLHADYSSYNTLYEFINSLTEDNYRIYHILLYYFPRYISYIFNLNYRTKYINNPTISYFFNYIRDNYTYVKKLVKTYELTKSYLCTYIRDGVDEAISKKVPYLAFKLISSQSYMPLCKFYKERFTTHEDTLRMYRSCGAKNFDEWVDMFIKYQNTNVINASNARNLTHEVELLQPGCNSNSVVDNLYNYFFTKC